MTPLDDEVSRAWVFSNHGDRLSGPCPVTGVELELNTAPKEGPSCEGIGGGEEMVPMLELYETCRPTSPTLVGAPYIVAREPETDVVGVNPTSDTSIRAADGRPSRLPMVKLPRVTG
jgi:hypothetical protein